ncbi:MAG: AbrB family transcriptional regulator [Synergistaceae bacterium]|jgi:membrane AbrB-like protein|nr:AbrB family transcriptional regulator [Synergistaceae bacterium]
MHSFFALIFLYFIGTLGYIAFKRLHLPLPALLGSLTVTAALALFGKYPQAPVDSLSALCKVAIGIMMGRRLDRNAVKLLRSMAAPAILICAWMVALSAASGLLMGSLSGIAPSSALIGSTTGGVSEMAIFALSQNYDAATITIISVSRLVGTLIVIPWIARRWSGHKHAEVPPVEMEPYSQSSRALHEYETMSAAQTLSVALLSIAAGILFSHAGIPAGMMLGALAASGGATLVLGRSLKFPPLILAAAQIGIGIAIARQFGPEQREYLTQFRFLFSIIVSGAFTIAASLLLAYILHKMTGWDTLTCLLSASAGGISQMVVLAEDMNADVLTVGILHLARYLAIVSCMPLLIILILER